MNVVRWRKRAMFCGCSHGPYISQPVANQVLEFAKDFKPHHRVHLGDAWDTAAFRQGAAGTTDESASIREDRGSGADFINAFRPTVFFMGNHEDRVYQRAHHHNAIIAEASLGVIEYMENLFRRIKCEIVPHAGTATRESWRMFGDTLAGHGFMYGEQCTRDHVEMLGHPCIHAHDHKAKMQPGRVVGAPMGYSVGTLATIPAMGYAKTRRATAAWCGGIVYGEYGEGWARWQLKVLHSSEGGTWQAPKSDRQR